MSIPGFTAETCVGTARRGYRSASATGDAGGAGAADASTLTPADRGVFLQIEDTLHYCYPCMSGGPAGALVTYCCDAVASTAGGKSWG